MDNLADRSCIVLGAGGFIGTNLCIRLHGRTRRLRAFGRRMAFPEALRGIEWFEGDFRDPTSLALALNGYDTVFHLVNATTPASSNFDMAADIQANVIPAIRLLEACKAEGIRQIIYVSSGGTIYGIPKVLPTPETAPTMPITAYGISKLTIEKFLSMYLHLHGLDYKVLRVANPFGPFQTTLKRQGIIAAALERALAGEELEIWGNGSVVRDYVYIDDVIEALVRVVTHDGPSRVFNIGGGSGLNLNQLIAVIEEALGRKLLVSYKKARPVDIPASILDLSLAKQELAWEPQTSLKVGIVKTLDWLSQHMATRA